VPTARSSRTISAAPEQLWELVCDPHHLPRWWPRVSRVENVENDAFTEVMMTRKGKVVRADFSLVSRDDAERALTWAQRIEGTPFARVLQSAETEVRIAAAPQGSEPPSLSTIGLGTEVTIELRQTLTGFFPRLGGMMVRRAATATIEEALDGLERISV
jgi:uncharacterized protein YndB with AHSA1/START domain